MPEVIQVVIGNPKSADPNNVNSEKQWSKERAEKLVLSLSRFFRYTLTASEKKKVILKDEIDIVRTYLSIEKNRYGKRLEYGIDVEGNIDHLYIIGLLLQPIVENSIKYGISSLTECVKITLKVS